MVSWPRFGVSSLVRTLERTLTWISATSGYSITYQLQFLTHLEPPAFFVIKLQTARKLTRHPLICIHQIRRSLSYIYGRQISLGPGQIWSIGRQCGPSGQARSHPTECVAPRGQNTFAQSPLDASISFLNREEHKRPIGHPHLSHPHPP